MFSLFRLERTSRPLILKNISKKDCIPVLGGMVLEAMLIILITMETIPLLGDKELCVVTSIVLRVNSTQQNTPYVLILSATQMYRGHVYF